MKLSAITFLFFSSVFAENMAKVTSSTSGAAIDFSFDGSFLADPLPEPMVWWYEICSKDQPFVTIELNWNPNGHAGGLSLKDAQYAAGLDPEKAMEFAMNRGAWSIPHFDLHYYILPRSSILQIDDARSTVVSDEYLPANYQCPPFGFEKEMGFHCFDVTKDYSVLDFTNDPEVIYGSYESKVNFLEAMYPIEFLEKVKNETAYIIEIPQPRTLPFKPFPKNFSFSYDCSTDVFRITMMF